MKIFIVAAHPDDEVLGCGGSIAKWSKKGYEVNVMIMAEGETSRDENRIRANKLKKLSELTASSNRANKILGVKNLWINGMPDNRMDSLDLLDVVKVIEKKIFKTKPQIVITHNSSDLNVDHQIVHRAVMTACRPQSECSVKKILTFEVPSSTEWNSPNIKDAFSPNLFEDITETLDLKISALKEYKSEMRPWPHPRSYESVRHLAYWRGSIVCKKAAEAFMLIRSIED